MFGSLGIPELLLIFIVALIVFGPKKLPEIGRTLGKAMGEFKKATDDFKNTIEREVHVEELKQLATSSTITVPVEETVSRTEPAAAAVTEAELGEPVSEPEQAASHPGEQSEPPPQTADLTPEAVDPHHTV
ncbi:MAG TPA: TatA/E family twin arginine-targeting protein translocase [Thermoanaerobaculia bacterium]|jgi:TatA/E family protein of Tat protein translocase|nr:TatA/E family twin arginine-targeting protein translocase [Thermoanaerobaculia bacterium]